ncbi:adenylate/guanylate cyclase domain-containing protein [Leptospira ognonensis]|uniref:Adenylate/guanylate cyclase domain-containing protein n=1 Tax=Leptospira ognonensis TaxID=2484945 RepID=A0A4R9JWC3_9LEPT|nr:adenylate/guanylate cyclase domain-containing protein [Leptospira ognonensis]TGL56676.1 adenylate/guanylate cyclase domain-containing protein [Leptospira ognonensis]
MQFIDKLKSVYLFDQAMPANTRKLLKEEEMHGALMANRFRYIAGIAFLMSAIANLSNTFSIFGFLTNFGALFAYFTNTLIHGRILKSDHAKWKLKYEYISIFIDNTLIAITILNWYLIVGKGNPNFLIKNTLIFYFLIPLAFTLIQFRISLVLNTLIYFLFYYFLFFFYAQFKGGTTGLDWYEYVLGEEVIFADALVTKPVLFSFVSLSVAYGIYRSYVMLIRIGKAEAQKTSLARYFSPDLVEEITSKPDSIQTGRRQKVTVLFSDIRDFTHFSEEMDTSALSEFLTDYRRRMTKAVFDQSGTLDKFVGDAVMATFGTPTPSEEAGHDSKNAVASAKQMFVELGKFNEERRLRGETEIRIGIGIHSGDVFAGNIGTEDRMEYTVIGDTVNTASRIESACKTLNAILLISSDVWKEIGEPHDFTKTNEVRLAGKEKSVELYSWTPS